MTNGLSPTATILILLAALLCWDSYSAVLAAEQKIAAPLTKDAYEQLGTTRGVVLIAVRWDRKWKCGGYENAQLRTIAFDKQPSQKNNDADQADIFLDDAPLIMTKPAFDNYAFLVEPGEYGLSELQIKVARSVSDVGYFKVNRSSFLKEGKSGGGTFMVNAGEIVYIGHFYLDCLQQPTLWRYYPDGQEAFKAYLGTIKNQFPMLNLDKAVFRLFKTKEFGNDYQLKISAEPSTEPQKEDATVNCVVNGERIWTKLSRCDP